MRMDNLSIFETKFWQVTHRRDSRLPGYLMASFILDKCELGDLPSGALLELGGFSLKLRTFCTELIRLIK